MSDNIDIPVTAGSPDPIDRLTAAVDRLHSSIDSLANARTSAFEKQMAQMQKSTLTAMKTMQASMTTGFAELAKLAQAGGAAQVREASATGDKLLKEQLKWEAKQHAAANKFHYKKIGDEVAAENRRAAALQSLIEKRDMETYRARERDHASYVKFWERQIAVQEAAQAKQRALEQDQQYKLAGIRGKAMADAEAAAERQRRLNTSFLTATPGSQLRTARAAQAYAGMGGDASARYGSAAATASIVQLQQAHAQLTGAVDRSGRAIFNHNHLMHEGHSLARGLSGALGGLWLTYGSLAPLLAGAAIAASLKGIVTAGKEVEEQLNFVTALTKEDVSLDRFLHITDSSLRSVKESAEAMRMLAQNGLNANQSLRALPAILDLATIGEMTVGQAALAATGATAAFGLQMGEAGRVADIFAITAANSNTSVLAMTESMKQASTVASLFKVTIEETAGMLGLLAKINVTGSAAGTSMTNMLTGLYEPTEKGKKALQELGIETHNASGALKPLTQLLEEMRSALGRFNDSARVDILGSIFTVRGVKSAELALQNIDEFKAKVKEAQGAAGFMYEAVRQLEDSTAGVFGRLGVTVQNTFVKSFAEASPYVQRLGLDLNHAFKDEGTQSALENLATNIARLTLTAAENADVIGMLVGGWLAYRTLGPLVVGVLTTANTATVALTTAQTAAAAASATFNAAHAAGTATTAMYTAAVEAQTAATVAATAATRAWGATVMPLLGAAAIAVGVLGAAWLLLRDNTTEAERANLKISNSLDVVGEALEKEIERLTRLNELWDERNGKFSTEDMGAQSQVQKARMQVIEVETQILMSGGDPAAARKQQWQERGGRTVLVDSHPLGAALREADANLSRAQQQFDSFEKDVSPARNLVNLRQQSEQLMADIEKTAALSRETNSKGEYTYNESLRQVFAAAGGLRSNLETILQGRTGGVEQGTYDLLKNQIDQVSVDLKQIKDRANSMQQGRAPKVTEGPGSPGYEDQLYRAALIGLEEKLQDAQKEAQTTKRDIQSMFDAGAISAVAATEKIKEADLKLAAFTIENADDRAALAVGRPADIARAGKLRASALSAINEAEKEQQRLLNEEIKNAERDKTQYLIDQARKAGDTAMVYRLQHAEALERNDANLVSAREMLVKGMEEGDGKIIASALRMINAFSEVQARADEAIATATAVDEFKRAEREFDQVFTSIHTRVSELMALSADSGGLAGMFTYALAAEKEYDTRLGQLQQKHATLQAKASATGRPEDQVDADRALGDMNKLSDQMRRLWEGVGHSIERSLTVAFGKAGKAAGGMVNVMIGHAATEKRIHADLAKHQGKADYEERRIRAIKELDSVALTTYGHMAGAAKAYFEEGSSGYEALEKVERAFHAAQLAMVASEMVAKLFATQTVTAAKTTAAATEGAAAVATVPVVMGAEAAKANAYGVTALAAALALPFPASLPAYATVAAMLAAIGVAVSGGGAGKEPLSEQRQKKMGTGSVLGDANKASESISKALENIEKLTIDGLDYSAGMLDALRAIQGSIGGLANMVTRSLGLDGTDRVSNTVQNSSLPTKLLGIGAGAASGAAIGYGISLIGSVMGPIGMVLGGLIGGLLNKFSKVKTELLDQGIKLNSQSLGQASQGVTGVSYQDVKTKKSFLGITYSNNSDRASAPISDELKNQFTAVVANLREGILTAVTAIGEGGDAFVAKLDSLAVTIPEISLKGLTGEQIQEKLESVFSKLGDDLAIGATTQVPMKVWLQDFQKVGEGAFETLMRLATEYKAVDATLGMLGKSFGAVGQASLAARHQLVEMAGGIDELVSQTSFFAKNFLSKSEQIAPLQAELAKQVNPLNGGSAVTTMEQYKNLVMRYAGDTSEAGMKAYSVLLKLAPVFKTVADAAKEVAEESNGLRDQLDQYLLKPSEYEAKKRALERAQLDPANRDLFDQVQAAKLVAETREQLVEAYEREKSAMEENIERVRSLADSWKKFKTDLKLGDKSPLTPQEKYLEAKAQFHTTLARAQAGDTKAQDAFQAVAEKFLETSRVVNTSSPEYARDFNLVLSATDQAIVWAERQVDVGKASLDALKQQVSYLIDIEAATLSVTQAINALALLLGPQGGAAADANTRGVVEGLYQSLLGRSGDAAGVDFWTNALRSGGVSIADVVQAISRSVEFMNRTAPVNVPGAQPGPDQITPSALNRLYENMLGRAPDAAGAQFWMDAMRSGSTMDDVTRAIMGSAEYQQRNTAFQGAAANSGAFAAQSGSNALADLVAQVRRMNDELAELRREQAQQVQDQIDAAFASTQAAADVMAQATAEAAESSAWANRSQAEFA